MIKKIVIMGCLLALSSLSFASSCPRATATNQPEFCGSFKTAAQCHCTSSGLPAGMCSNMKLLYSRMLSAFGSVQRACEFQHDVSAQECIDNWNCYRSGGHNVRGELCNGTGAACE